MIARYSDSGGHCSKLPKVMQLDFRHAGNDKGTALSGPGIDNCTYNHATIYNSSFTVCAELRKVQSSSHTPVLACHGQKEGVPRRTLSPGSWMLLLYCPSLPFWGFWCYLF